MLPSWRVKRPLPKMERAVPLPVPLAEAGKGAGTASLVANLEAGAVMVMGVDLAAGEGMAVPVPCKVAGVEMGVKVVIAGARAVTGGREDTVAIAGAGAVLGGREARGNPGKCPLEDAA